MLAETVIQSVTLVADTSASVIGVLGVGLTDSADAVDDELSGLVALAALGRGVEEGVERTVLVGSADSVVEVVAGVADAGAGGGGILGVGRAG